MPPSRRSLLLTCTSVLPLVAGCSALEDPASVERVSVEIVNVTETDRVYHVLLGTADGIRALASEPVAADETTTVESDTGDIATVTGVHVVVGEHHLSDEPWGLESGEACLRYLLHHRPDTEPVFLSSADISCEE